MTACINTNAENNKKNWRKGENVNKKKNRKEWEENLQDCANAGDLEL